MCWNTLTDEVPQALTDNFRRELQKFDTERILPAWDGLIAKQQAALESLGVPAMFPTSAPSEREVWKILPFHSFRCFNMTDFGLVVCCVAQKQQKVMQVLVGVAEE